MLISLGKRLCTLKYFRLLNSTFERLGQIILLKAVEQSPFPYALDGIGCFNLVWKKSEKNNFDALNISGEKLHLCSHSVGLGEKR